MRNFAIEPLVRAALAEDMGRSGDLTTDALVDAERTASATIVARRAGTIFGHEAAALTFKLLDEQIVYRIAVADGQPVEAGAQIATLRGRARTLLTGERTALNFLGHLCGIATATRALVDAVAGTGARIADTRKTTPGLRMLEKAAVRAGGGGNHRFGLYDAVLIKDNHIVLAGGIRPAIAAARVATGHTVKLEVEVDTLDQLRDVLAEPGVDAVLLDNMPVPLLKEAVQLAGGRLVTEASGNISIANVAAVARTGVNVISVGWLTHSAPALDLSMEIAI
ncbi:MAG: carboxylating nicotinate-nucleotide diphosphorylase [Candidatus Meridianibacter frigidus]|nr:MAG: carboxylating nicotinate-nucleotide diphosphorylase [Candidatus Eremiobacteraeota bacterium]